MAYRGHGAPDQIESRVIHGKGPLLVMVTRVTSRFTADFSNQFSNVRGQNVQIRKPVIQRAVFEISDFSDDIQGGKEIQIDVMFQRVFLGVFILQ